MWPKFVIATVASVLVWPGTMSSEQLGAVPDTSIAGGLLLTCKDTPNDSPSYFLYRYCMGVVDGVAATLNLLQKIEMPSDVSKSQKMAVVAKYLQDHPELLQEPSIVLVNNALVEARPAKKVQAK